MAAIKLVSVTKDYPDGHRAVKDLSLEIADGEFVILVGPSGCGKSTVLRMIAGLEDITSGELRVDGELINGLPARDRDLAMVFQNYALYPHMSVRENLGFALKLRKTDRGTLREKVDEAARILDLTQHLERKPSQLSGGQRQRVAMGRAIVRDPKAFLMDEPLSNLDAKLRVQMRTQIALLQQRLGTTTVYVTHDQTEAMTLGDRVAVMNAGVLQQVGSPMDLYNEPANLFVAGFIGSPAMNFMRGVVGADKLRLPMGVIDLPPVLAPRDVKEASFVVGVRPQSFSDATGGAPEHALTFTATIDVLEALGSELFAHFSIHTDHGSQANGASALPEGSIGREVLDQGPTDRLVARLDPASRIAEGAQAKLSLDPAGIHLFDPASGARLTAAKHAAADLSQAS